MKDIPIFLKAHYSGQVTTVAYGLRIQRPDDTIFAFTSDSEDVDINGTMYLANPGLDVSGIEIAAGSGVGNLELTTLHDGTVFTTNDILGGLWRNSTFYLFRYNYNNPDQGIEQLLGGTFGEVELRQTTVVVELRDWRQYWQQQVGSITSKTCRYRLGDEKCKVVLAPFTVTTTVSSVTNRQTFRTVSMGKPDDYFGEGEVTWLSGNNIGQRAKVRAFAADGTFTLALPMYGAVSVGDQYKAIAGCRKRLMEDCKPKYNNVLNFGGEPHRKGMNDVTKEPDPIPGPEPGGGDGGGGDGGDGGGDGDR